MNEVSDKYLNEQENDKEINFNNGEEVIKKFENEPISEEIPVIRLNKTRILKTPHISDENIKNNSKFLSNLFDSNISNDREKSLTLNK